MESSIIWDCVMEEGGEWGKYYGYERIIYVLGKLDEYGLIEELQLLLE